MTSSIRRFCSGIFDYCFTVGLSLTIYSFTHASDEKLLISIFCIVFLIYELVLLSSFLGGRTLGMRILGLELQRRGGGWVLIPQLVTRATVHCLSTVIVLAAVLDMYFNYVLPISMGLWFGNFYLLAAHPRHQLIHDLSSWSIVMPAKNIGIRVESMGNVAKRKLWPKLVLFIFLGFVMASAIIFFRS